MENFKLDKSVIVIGGGIAGIEVSNLLSGLGYEVVLLEKSDQIGGKLLDWDRLFPTFRKADEVVQRLTRRINQLPVKIVTNSEITGVANQNGMFTVTVNHDNQYNADVLVVTTGFELFNARRKEEYGYGIYDNVITSADLEKKFKTEKKIVNPQGKIPQRVAFVHCVGSRDEKVGNHYCSKVCCVTGVKQAIEFQEQNPNVEIYNFYMDLRMYGEGFEELYRKAQELHQVQFIRGRVSEVSENIDHSIQLKAEDTLSGRPLKMNVDLLILLSGMEPGKGSESIKKRLNLGTMESGFLEPADVHLSRNVSSMKGVFMAGTCICPMSVNDTLENARSAASEVHHYFQNIG
jgi:heterodisulfide reductase subunit A